MRSRWSFYLGSLFGISVEVHFTFFLLLALFGWYGFEAGGLFNAFWDMFAICLIFLCVLMHEFGHSLVAQRYKITVHRILLLPIGGMAQFARVPKQPTAELLITVAGPAVNFVIAAFLWLIVGWPEAGLESIIDLTPLDFYEMGVFILYINLLMGIFNLIPAFPMDGGRIFRSLLAYRLPYTRATQIAVYTGKVLSAGGAIFAILYLQSIFLAILFGFIFFSGDAEYQLAKQQEQLRGLRVIDITRRQFLALDMTSTLNDALAMLSSSLPQDILILNNGSVEGIISIEHIQELSQRVGADELLARYMLRNFEILQADWPVEGIADQILANPYQTTFPVFDLGRLMGVVDAVNLRSMLFWKDKLREKGETTPPIEAKEIGRTRESDS